MSLTGVLEYLRPCQADMLAVVKELVDQETPSADKAALDRLGQQIARRFTELGLTLTIHPQAQRGDHLELRLPASAGAADAQPGLILCHFDTVWPVGTLATRPFRVDDGRAFGPGIFDMKASFALVEYALRAITALGLRRPRPIIACFTADEEVGSGTSRALIERLASTSAYVLVMESPLAGGRLKTARKGVGRFIIDVTGRAAHAGIEPEKGINAIIELAHQALTVSGLADPAAGTTLNVGVIQGGTTPNVVPAQASARVDVRVTRLAEAQRIEAALAALRPVLSGAQVQVTGGFSRPPMERTGVSGALFERAQAIARELGQELTEGATGGASDGNFTAALGVATLDGLGALGAGAHAEDEQIQIDSLPTRAALLAALLLHL